MKEVAIISKNDLTKAEGNVLNENQLQFILAKTPKSQIKSRPAKGGGVWNYVSGSYVKKVLNLMFGWDWDFQIIEQIANIEFGEIVVKGRLTVRSGGKTIIKEQFGNKEIMFKKGTKIPLSFGNDLKAAATDALKKCANDLGIAQDVYAPQEFKEVEVKEAITRDIAIELIQCKDKEEITTLWQSLKEYEQVKYKKLFDRYEL